MQKSSISSILFQCPSCELRLSVNLPGMQEYVCPRCAVRFLITASVSLSPMEGAESISSSESSSNHSSKRFVGSLVPRLRPRSERVLLKLEEIKH